MSYTPGPFISEHWVLQWGGQMPGGEQWSNMLRICPSTHDPVPDPTTVEGAAVSAAVKVFFGAIGCGAYTNLDHVKLNPVGIDGKYKNPFTFDDTFAPISGGGGANLYPNQVALVLSWETGLTRGPAHEGRIYLPSPTQVITANTDWITEAAAHAVDVAGGAFIAALGAAVPADMWPCVMSRKLGAPAAHNITTTRCGRVLDTQRRRRRSVPEMYVL